MTTFKNVLNKWPGCKLSIGGKGEGLPPSGLKIRRKMGRKLGNLGPALARRPKGIDTLKDSKLTLSEGRLGRRKGEREEEGESPPVVLLGSSGEQSGEGRREV